MTRRLASAITFYLLFLRPIAIEAQTPTADDQRQREDLMRARACMSAASSRSGHDRAEAMAVCTIQLPATLSSMRASFAAMTAEAYSSEGASAAAIRWATKCFRDTPSAPSAELSARLRRGCASLIRQHFRSVAWVRSDDAHCDWTAREATFDGAGPSDVVRVEQGEWTAVRAAHTTLSAMCERAPRVVEGPTPQVAVNVSLHAATRYRITQTTVRASDNW